MKVEVSSGIEELKRQFHSSTFTVREDGQGGAYVILEPVTLGSKYLPSETWLGFQIPAQYPYADIYPVFMGGNVVRADGTSFAAPLSAGHQFEGRPAVQISRRYSAAQTGMQRVLSKVLKILRFLEN